MQNDLIATPFLIIFLMTPFVWLFFVIQKKYFHKLFNQSWSRAKISLVFLGLLVTSFIGFGIFVEPTKSQQEANLQILGSNEETEEVVGLDTELKAEVEKGDSQKQVAKVARVIDGDTIELESGEKVRYIGIDSPESVDPNKPEECFAQEAAQKNEDLVLNKEVELEKDVSDVDRYDRLLRYVYADGEMVNEVLVKEGYAYASAYPPDIKYQDLFDSAQKEAREGEKGLWGDVCKPTPTTKPILTPTAKPTVRPTLRPTAVPPSSKPTLRPTTVPPSPKPQVQNTEKPTTNSYGCDCSKTCSQMSSCDEAYYQLNNCGCGRRDGDNDGVPCESICPGG